jgi:hypothetical protein
VGENSPRHSQSDRNSHRENESFPMMKMKLTPFLPKPYLDKQTMKFPSILNALEIWKTPPFSHLIDHQLFAIV